jgi:purine-nucleoside/S-methyl-5'-thioadenosine phosphorylase / adenosine deaminase
MATATLPQLTAPFRWDGEHIAADLPGTRALFTTRRGGVSTGPFTSMNLGRKTDDDYDNVRENRARVAAATGCPWEQFLFGWQVHGATVLRGTGPQDQDKPRAKADGQATALIGHPVLAFGADCQPILLAADGGVAALHAGWRTLAAGIVAEGVTALRDVGGTGPITALIGPGARGCCYEVGEEVHAEFAQYDARRGERNLDLAAVARQQLAEHGVDAVHDTGLCTMCWFGLFFSHRRDGGVTGRQAGVVWRA